MTMNKATLYTLLVIVGITTQTHTGGNNHPWIAVRHRKHKQRQEKTNPLVETKNYYQALEAPGPKQLKPTTPTKKQQQWYPKKTNSWVPDTFFQQQKQELFNSLKLKERKSYYQDVPNNVLRQILNNPVITSHEKILRIIDSIVDWYPDTITMIPDNVPKELKQTLLKAFDCEQLEDHEAYTLSSQYTKWINDRLGLLSLQVRIDEIDPNTEESESSKLMQSMDNIKSYLYSKTRN
jgi:hypothetical protein